MMYVVAAVTVCGPVRVGAQSRVVEATTAPFSAGVYRTGERLTYNVSYSQFNTAAYVELFVAGMGTDNGRTGVELRAKVETAGVVGAAIYSVNNEYISIVDPATGLPFRSQLLTREAGGVVLPGELPPPVTVFSNRPNTFDLLSAIYRLRALPPAEGAAYRLSVANGEEQFDVEVRAGNRELVRTSVGSFNCVVMSVRAPGNKRVDDLRLRVYLSDDAQRLPVRVAARINSGEIRADLASVAVESEAPAAVPPAGTPAVPPRPTPVPTIAARPNTGNASADLPFAVGEQLNYQVYLGNGQQPLAMLAYQVRPRANYFGRNGLLITAAAQTTALGNRLFVINDQISSYVNPVTLLPFRTEVRLQEGRRRVATTLTIEQDRGIAISEKGQRIEIPVGTHDLVSVLYAMRSFDLRPGKRNAVSLLINGRPRTLSVEFSGSETISLGAQQIPAVRLALTTDDPESNRFNLRLWVGTDSRRLPLRITATTPLGALRADLAVLPATVQ